MTEENYCIYKHTSPSGKSYIGITKQGKKRFGKDGNGYKKQRKFYNANFMFKNMGGIILNMKL